MRGKASSSFWNRNREILVAHDGEEVAAHLRALTPERARAIGQAALARVLADHTYAHRAAATRGSARCAFLPAGAVAVKIVFLGLSITSSWGNGHATTYRGLDSRFAERGHEVLVSGERCSVVRGQSRPAHPPYGKAELYGSSEELKDQFRQRDRRADLTMVGSYVPEGVAVGEWVLRTRAESPPSTISTLRLRWRSWPTGDYEYFTPELAGALSICTFPSPDGPTLQRIRRLYGAAHPRALYCSVDPALYYPGAP